MTIETEVAGLTSAVNTLTAAVNVKKATLDAAAAAADARATAAASSVTASAASAATAQAQASLAAGYAASAASVAQLDLSGVTAAALHRSPTEARALYVYDTSKDSDGGAWTERCQHTSWYSEPLTGKWLGAQVSETAARAVSGAATGDYFQLTTTGKFYSLNATSGLTEVFRGNRRDFPKLAAIVGGGVTSNQQVVIYDLTEPGRPMWMSFISKAPEGSVTALRYMSGATIAHIQALNGNIFIGHDTGLQYYTSFAEVNFPKDEFRVTYPAYGDNGVSYGDMVGRRNETSGHWSRAGVGGGDAFIVYGESDTQGLLAFLEPDAPLDAATGLPLPSLIRAATSYVVYRAPNGAVRRSNPLANAVFKRPVIRDGVLYVSCGANGNLYSADMSAVRSGAFTFGVDTDSAPPDFNLGTTTTAIGGGKVIIRAGTGVQMLRPRRSALASSPSATLTNACNTGWMVGDIRRAYLCDASPGTLAATVADRSYKAATATATGTLTLAPVAEGTSLTACAGWSAANSIREATSVDLDFGTGEWCVGAWVKVPASVSAPGVIAERAGASGPSLRLAVTATGALTATASDGTTTRTVTTTTAYTTASWTKAEACYTTDGGLAIRVNGAEVAVTRGTPLLSLNNPNAVLTIGNGYDLAAPFPGSLALLKLGATVPTPEQSAWMYAQEAQMFRPGAISILPDAAVLVDLAYDEATDRWIGTSPSTESTWSGLVRTGVRAVPAGAYSRVAAGGGITLSSRVTTTPGVDVTIPSSALRSELVRRAEAAARLSREVAVLDYGGGFSASTTAGSTALTGVAGLASPAGIIGARVSGAGIPAGASIVGMSGTTLYLSAAATATASGVAVSFVDFALPAGLRALAVTAAGALKQEGATKDFTRLNDGFVEAVRFGVAPGASAWVQIQATKGGVQ